MKNTKNKIVLITGGTGLIGESIINEFIKCNYIVIFTYLKNKTKADKIMSLHKNIYAYKVKIENSSSIEKMLKSVNQKFGKLDVLINNAGINKPEDFNKIKEKDWDKILAVNLKGPFLLMQKTIYLLRKSNFPCVINISSVSGQYGGPRTAHYATSKAGLISLSQVFARFAIQFGIRSNTIAVGLIESPLAQKGIKSPIVKKQLSNILQGRMGLPKEVADMCIFLSSEKSSYMTAQTINLNGGLYF